MGCLSSRYNDYWDSNKGVFVDEIGFHKFEIHRLFDKFTSCDKRDTWNISSDDFFSYFKLDRNDDIVNRIFFSLDVKEDGHLDFCQFVCTLWNFLSLPSEELGAYAHFLFDDDKKGGTLRQDQIKELVAVLLREKCENESESSKILNELLKKKWKFSASRFNKWTLSNKSLLKNLNDLQEKLQLNVLGKEFWIILRKKRTDSKLLLKPVYIHQVLSEKYSGLKITKTSENKDGIMEDKVMSVSGKTDEQTGNSELQVVGDGGAINEDASEGKKGESTVSDDGNAPETNRPLSTTRGVEILPPLTDVIEGEDLDRKGPKVKKKSKKKSKENKKRKEEKKKRKLKEHLLLAQRLGKNIQIADLDDKDAVEEAEILKRKKEKRDRLRRERRAQEEKESELKNKKPTVTSVSFSPPLAQRLTAAMSGVEKEHMKKKILAQIEVAEIAAGVREPSRPESKVEEKITEEQECNSDEEIFSEEVKKDS